MASIARNRLQRIAQTAGKFHKPKPQLIEAAKKTQWNIIRGDKVQVIGNHPERGKQGIIKAVLRDKDRVIVEGVNMGPRNIKGDKDRGIPGKVIMKERTIHYSNVNLVDPVLGVPTRIIKKILDTGEKVRVSKKSGTIIPRPEILKFRRKPISSIVTESCTSEDDAWEISYQDYVPPSKI
jgi:large subunit ribosomal protein L24